MQPKLTVLADLMMFITGKVIFIIALLFVRKSRTIADPSWTWSKKEVICWLHHHLLYHNYVWQKLITMNCFIVMWLCPSICWKHAIWHMPRIWHQPSQVGKAYEWFHCWNCVVLSETLSDHPGVTVATLCWGFGTQQSLIFCCLMRCHNFGGSLLLFS